MKYLKSNAEFLEVMAAYRKGKYNSKEKYYVYNDTNDDEKGWYSFNFKNGNINYKKWKTGIAAREYSKGTFTLDEYKKVDLNSITINSVDKFIDYYDGKETFDISYQVRLNNEYFLSGSTSHRKEGFNFLRNGKLTIDEAKKVVLEDFRNEFLFKPSFNEIKSPLIKEAALRMWTDAEYNNRFYMTARDVRNKVSEQEFYEFINEIDEKLFNYATDRDVIEVIYELNPFTNELTDEELDQDMIYIYPELKEMIDFAVMSDEREITIYNNSHKNVDEVLNDEWEEIRKQLIIHDNLQKIKDMDKAIELYNQSLIQMEKLNTDMDIHQINNLMCDIYKNNPYQNISDINLVNSNILSEDINDLVSIKNEIDDELDDNIFNFNYSGEDMELEDM